MDYKELIENQDFSSSSKIADWIWNATCAITDLLARAEAAEKDLADCREKNAGLALALLTEQPPNSDCLGDQEWQAVRNCVKEAESRARAAEYELEQRKVYYDQMVDALAAVDSKELEEANEKLKSAEARSEKAEREREAAVKIIPHECKTCVYHTVIFNGCTPDHDCTNPDGGCSNNYDRWIWIGTKRE